MRTAICAKCGKSHEIDGGSYEMFGPDAYCLGCIERDHLTFMQKNAKKLGLTCAPGCICGFGKGGASC